MRHHKWVTYMYMYVQGWCTHTRRIIIIENFPNYRREMKSICMHRSNLQYDAQLGNTPVGNGLHSHCNSHSRGIHRSNLAVCCAMRHDLRFCVRCKLAQNTIHRIATRRQRCNSALLTCLKSKLNENAFVGYNWYKCTCTSNF